MDTQTPRIPFYNVAPDAITAMLELEKYLHNSSLDRMLIHLVKLRASQINGCAYCIDMHAKDLLAGGETVQRIYGLDAWREAPYYSERERAALEWTEAVTLINQTHAEDEAYEDRQKGADHGAFGTPVRGWKVRRSRLDDRRGG